MNFVVMIGVDTVIYSVSKYGLHHYNKNFFHNIDMEDAVIFALSDLGYEKLVKKFLPSNYFSFFGSDLSMRTEKFVGLSILSSLGMFLLDKKEKALQNVIAIGLAQGVQLAVDKLRIME